MDLSLQCVTVTIISIIIIIIVIIIIITIIIIMTNAEVEWCLVRMSDRIKHHKDIALQHSYLKKCRKSFLQ